MEYRDEMRYARNLAANVDALKQRGQELAARLEMLKTDRESVIVLARDVGLYEPGDAVVKLVGRPQRNETYAMGDLLRRRKPDVERNSAFKEGALGAAFVLLLAAFIEARAGRGKPGGARRR